MGAVETDLGTLTLVTSVGGVDLLDLGALTLQAIQVVTSGDMLIQSLGAMLVDGVVSGAGAVTLRAIEDGGVLTNTLTASSQARVSSGGALLLESGDRMEVASCPSRRSITVIRR